MQIQSIGKRNEIHCFNNESEMLIKYMMNNGISKCFEIEQDNSLKRIAIFTMNRDEIQNLKNYGDVIFIDGTHVHLNLKWEVFPITAITKDMTICSCGILYTAVSNEEILKWLLYQICSFDEVRNKIKTIVTDEDNALSIAFNNFIKEINANDDGTHIIINHVHCALH